MEFDVVHAGCAGLRGGGYLHGELPACHPEVLHHRGHLRSQARRGGAALARQGLGRRLVTAGGFALRGIERLQILAGVEQGQGGLPFLVDPRQLPRRLLEAPRQAEPQGNAVVKRLHLRGVPGVPAQVAVQGAQRFVGLRQAVGQQEDGVAELRLQVLLGAQRGQRLRQCRAGAAVVVFQAVGRVACCVLQRLGVAEAGMFLVQCIPLARLGGKLVEFTDLPLQALALRTGGFLRCARLGQCLVGRTPGGPGLRDTLGVRSGVGVEQIAHCAGPRELLPGMLAMDVEQGRGQLAQLRRSGRAAVDPPAALATGIHRAAQQQFAVGFKPPVLQPGRERSRQIEAGTQFGTRGALADHAGVCTGAQHQLQCVDEYGFSGPGFARERGKPGLEFELQGIDDDEIAQAEMAQRHGQEPPSFQRSLRRKVSK